MIAAIYSTHPRISFHRNLQLSDAYNEFCSRKYTKREMRRRWPDEVERLHGAFKIDLSHRREPWTRSPSLSL